LVQIEIFTLVGDVGSHIRQAQNIAKGAPLDGTGDILRVTQGQPVANPQLGGATVGGGGPAGNSNMSKYYYAYGIRNSFGLGFDPVTGKLWDTENGPSFGHEINLIDPAYYAMLYKNMRFRRILSIGEIKHYPIIYLL
jgi:hypothetical protein